MDVYITLTYLWDILIQPLTNEQVSGKSLSFLSSKVTKNLLSSWAISELLRIPSCNSTPLWKKSYLVFLKTWSNDVFAILNLSLKNSLWYLVNSDLISCISEIILVRTLELGLNSKALGNCNE